MTATSSTYTSQHFHSAVRIQLFWKHRLLLARERLRRKELDDAHDDEERRVFLRFQPSWTLLRRNTAKKEAEVAAETVSEEPPASRNPHRYPSEPSLSQASSSSPPPATPPAADETSPSISAAANVIKFFIRARVWLRQLRQQRLQRDKLADDEERVHFAQYQPSPQLPLGGSRRAGARQTSPQHPDVVAPSDSRSSSPHVASNANAALTVGEPASLSESTIQAITEATAALIDGAMVSMAVEENEAAADMEPAALRQATPSPGAGDYGISQGCADSDKKVSEPPPSESNGETNREMTVDELPTPYSPPKGKSAGPPPFPEAQPEHDAVSLLEDDEGEQRYEAVARSIAKLQILHRNFVDELLSRYSQQESSQRLSLQHTEAAGRTNLVELRHLAVAHSNARHLSAIRIQCWLRSLRAKVVLRLRSARRTRDVMQRIASELSTAKTRDENGNYDPAPLKTSASPVDTTTTLERSISHSLEQQARICAALAIQRCFRGHTGRCKARQVSKSTMAAMRSREQQEESEIPSETEKHDRAAAAIRSELERRQQDTATESKESFVAEHTSDTTGSQDQRQNSSVVKDNILTDTVTVAEQSTHKPTLVVATVDEATEASPTKSDGGCQTEPQLLAAGCNGTTVVDASSKVEHSNELVQTDERTIVDASTQVSTESAPATSGQTNATATITATTPPPSSQRPNSARVPSKPNQPPPARRPTTAVASRRSSAAVRSQPYVDQSFDTSSILRSLAAVGVHRSSLGAASTVQGNYVVDADEPLDIPIDDLDTYVAAASLPASAQLLNTERTHVQPARKARDPGRTLGYSGMLAKLKEVLEVAFEWSPTVAYGISLSDLLDSLYAALYPQILLEVLDQTAQSNHHQLSALPALMLDVPVLEEGSPASPPVRNPAGLAALWKSEDFVARVIHHLSRLVVPESEARDHVYLFDEVALVILSAIPVGVDQSISGTDLGGSGFGKTSPGLIPDELGPYCDGLDFGEFCRALRTGMMSVAEERKAAGSATIAATFSFLDVHRRRLVPRALFERVFSLRVALPPSVHPVAIPYLPFVELLRRNLIRSPAACQKQLGFFFEKILLAPSWVHVGGARRQAVDRLESALRTHASDLLDAVQLVGVRSGVLLHDSLALYSSLLPTTSRRNMRWLCLAFLVSMQSTYGETVVEAFDRLADVVRRLAAPSAPLEVQESQEITEGWMSIFRRLTLVLESSALEEALRIQKSCNGSAARQNVYRSPASLTEEMDRCVPWSVLDPAALDAAAFFASQHPTNFAPELTQMIPVTEHGFLTLDPSIVRRNPGALRAELPRNSASTHVSNYDLRREQLNHIFYALRHYLLTVNDISEFQFMNRLGAPGRKSVQTPKEAEAALVQFVENLPSVSRSCPWTVVSRDVSRGSGSGAVFTERFSQMIFALSNAEYSQRRKHEGLAAGDPSDRATSNVSSASSAAINSAPPATSQTPLTRPKSAVRPSPTEICSPPSRQVVHSTSSSPKLEFKPPQQPFFRVRQTSDSATTFSANVPPSKTTSMEAIMTTFRGVPVSRVTTNRASELVDAVGEKTAFTTSVKTLAHGASTESVTRPGGGVYGAFRSEYSASKVAKTAVAVVEAQSNPRLQALFKK